MIFCSNDWLIFTFTLSHLLHSYIEKLEKVGEIVSEIASKFQNELQRNAKWHIELNLKILSRKM